VPGTFIWMEGLRLSEHKVLNSYLFNIVIN
jgi:hypothetical protein